jgi:uncharacterized protein YjbJ (UPF0337 family)
MRAEKKRNSGPDKDASQVAELLTANANLMSCDVQSHVQSTKENVMKKEQATGRAQQAKGKVKEVAGKAVGNKTMQLKGKAEKAAGAVKSGYGDAKNKAGKDQNAQK